MIRHSSKMVIIGSLLVIFSLALMFQPLFTWALELNDIRGCAFEVDPKEFLFQLGNMNPGDTYKKTVTITKTGPSPGKIYFSLIHIDSDPLYPDEDFNLFEQLELIVMRGDQVLYEGPMVGGASPGDPLLIEDFEYLVPMAQGDDVLLDFIIILLGPTTGNEYQGAFLEAELIFVSVCQDTPIPAINIKKYTNGVDADTPTGPYIPVGGAVTWTYEVTNPGHVPLRNVTVTDNRAGVNPVYVSGDTNADGVLQPAEKWIYRATGIAVAGQYVNLGTVVGTPPTGPNVTDRDPSHYYGLTTNVPSINIEKATNGVDADTPTGPYMPVGGAVTWTYMVTNTGAVPLRNIFVSDNRAGVNPLYVSGDNGDSVLQPGESWLYRATGVAVAGQYSNIGTVVGTPPSGPNVTDSDPSHYYGITTHETEIDIEKYTNGFDADLPAGPQVLVGSNVTWTYVVANPNTIPLYNIVVTDNRIGVTPVYVSGDISMDNVLQPNEIWTYRATGAAVAGQYANIGTVTGVSATGKPVTDRDPSHYFGFSLPPAEEEIEPEEPEVEPETPVIIVPPEGPKVSPPLPRTGGMPMFIFLIGFVFIAVGMLLKKGTEDKKGRSMQI